MACSILRFAVAAGSIILVLSDSTGSETDSGEAGPPAPIAVEPQSQVDSADEIVPTSKPTTRQEREGPVADTSETAYLPPKLTVWRVILVGVCVFFAWLSGVLSCLTISGEPWELKKPRIARRAAGLGGCVIAGSLLCASLALLLWSLDWDLRFAYLTLVAAPPVVGLMAALAPNRGARTADGSQPLAIPEENGETPPRTVAFAVPVQLDCWLGTGPSWVESLGGGLERRHYRYARSTLVLTGECREGGSEYLSVSCPLCGERVCFTVESPEYRKEKARRRARESSTVMLRFALLPTVGPFLAVAGHASRGSGLLSEDMCVVLFALAMVAILMGIHGFLQALGWAPSAERSEAFRETPRWSACLDPRWEGGDPPKHQQSLLDREG